MHDVPSQLADSPLAVAKPLAHNCLSLYHRASAQRRFAMSASMLKCEDFASTYAKGGTDRARSLARVPHMTKGASLSQRTSWHSVTRFASRLERGLAALQAG
jgi:hypothetical protein